MTTSISGTSGITNPAGGTSNTAGTGVGTTDSQTLTNKTITSPNIGGTPVMNASVITVGTAWTYTSGTPATVDFTALPSWVERITILFQNVSTTGTSNVGIQLGTGSTTYTTTGYAANGNTIAGGAVSSVGYTTIFALGSGNQTAASVMQGKIVLLNITGTNWVCSGSTAQTNTNAAHFTNGSLSLGAVLTAVRITTVGGTDTFDAGTINIFYE